MNGRKNMKRSLLIAALAGLSICTSALGDPFKGPGYELTCPEGWTIASQDMKDKVSKWTQEHLNANPNMHAMFFAPDKTTNINVVIAPGSFPADEEHLQEVRDGWASPRMVGAPNALISARLERFGADVA